MELENAVLLGDCLEVLRQIPDDYYHAVVTDAPYGLGDREPTPEEILLFVQGIPIRTGDFMNNDWDIPSVPVWKEVFRVLKPGGHVLCFGGCYDEHTEVLTRKGWVRFPDVTGDEEFASLDLETHRVEWQRPKEVVRQPHVGPMYYYRTNKVDLVVTPNHKMVVATLGEKAHFRLVRADTHGKAVRMTKTCKGRSDVLDPKVFRLPAVMQLTSHGHEKEVPEKVIPLEAWLPFFGLWLAEGSATISKNKPQHGHGSGYQVAIAHFDIENLREIQRKLSDWFDVRIYPKQGKLRINSKQLVLYLRQFGKAWEKFLPDWIKQLPEDHLRVLWDWYMRGDGCDHQRGYTSSPRLRDDWQEVAMYMGISADWSKVKKKSPSRIQGRVITPRRPQYVIRFNHTQSQPEVYDGGGKRNPVRTLIPEESWGGQTVYCVELPKHHTLYVRRNGKAVWCGNTRTWDLISLGLRMAGFESRDTIADEYPALQWFHGQGMPKSHNISKALDKKAGAKREVVGKSPYAARANKHSRAMSPGDLPRNAEDKREVTTPATPEAKLWDGYGTGLKPCWEPIVVFRKPFKGTVSANVLQHGTGALNIDACRVKHSSKADFEAHKAQVEAVKAKGGVREGSWKNASDLSGASDVTEAGRWPTNAVLAHHPECRKVGSKKIKGVTGGDTFVRQSNSRYEKAGGWYNEGRAVTRVSHSDEDGTETVEAWECVPGCPVAALDEQSGNRPSMLTGRADPDQIHEHPGEDKSSKSTFLGENREHLSKVYADEGGASRFFPQFEGDQTPEGRWPPNATLTHHPDCKMVGTRKVDAPVINRFDDGAKPFGDGAGHPYTSTQTGDADGKEEIQTWECVEGCPVKELDGQSGELRAGWYSGAKNKGMGYHGASSEEADGTSPSTSTGDSGGASRFFEQFQAVDVHFKYTAKPSKRETSLDGQIENDHPCLHPDSLVMTPHGYRPISVLDKGSLVLSADGHFHPVEATTRHPYTSPDLVEIQVIGSNITSLVSDNHPYLVWRPTRHGKKIIGGSVCWLRADEMTVGDYTMTPLVTGDTGQEPPRPDDSEFWFLLGLYLAEGWSQKAGHGENSYPRFALHEKETDLVDRIRMYFAPHNTSVYPNGERGITVVGFDPELGPLFAEICGSGAATKSIHPCVWGLPEESLRAFVEGYFAGDGGQVRDWLQAKTSSQDVGSQMRFLGEMLGYKAELQWCAPEPGGIGDREFKEVLPYYAVRLYSKNRTATARKPSRPTLLEHEGVTYLLSYVKRLTQVPYEGDVINLSVEGSHTFQTAVGMSHNTKKPLELMRWLVKLVTFKGARVLDLYCGSGTTLHAAAEEGVVYTGIERDKHSYEIAVRRMEIVLGFEQERQAQMDVFDLAMELGEEDEEDS